MSGFLYRGRHYGENKAGRPRSMCVMSDLGSEEAEKGRPVQTHSLREFEQHLADLKKENFSLKLRIYFLEERIQHGFEDCSTEDVHKRNIELKVEVESLKRELQEKQQQLDEALTSAESLANHNAADAQHQCEESRWEITRIQEVLETKIQLLNEEVRLAQTEAEEKADQLKRETKRAESLERKLTERTEAGDREAFRMKNALAEKDRLIEELRCRVGTADVQLEAVSEESNVQALIEEQQTRLVGQQQVRPLQARIRESEASNKELQRRMAEMQCELRSAREAAQLQDGAIQTLRDTLSTSRAQVSDLQQVVMEQKEMLVSLKSQGQQEQQGGVLALEASLFSSQLEMQHCQQALSHAHRREDDLTRANQRLHSDLQRAEQQREQAERHSQDLLCAVEDTRTRLVQLEDGMKEKEGERGGENTIRQLRNTLQNKERLLQDYSQMLDSGGKECVPSKLKLRIQERDCAVEQALDELRKLQLHLREKERDLEKLQCVCANNEETIMSLQALLRARDLEQEQVCVSLRNVQGVHRECEDRHKHTLLERDMLINQLQSCLHTFTKENKDLTSALISGQSVESASLLEELKTHLCVKEKLIQDLLSDRSRQVQQHQTQMQDMLNAIGSRDQYIQDAAGRAGEMIGAQTARLQEMRRQLACAQAAEGPGDPHDDVDVQALQEELQLAVRRERLAQQQLSTLRASLAQQDEQLQLQPALTPHFKGMTEKGPTCLTAVESDAASQSRAEFGEVDNVEDYSSDFVEEEENSKMTVKVLGATQGCVAPQTPQNSAVEEVKFLVEQKREVEKELMELRALLQRSGYSSLSEMKRALSSLHAENQELRDLLTQAQQRKEKPSRSQNGELCERAVQPEALQPSRDLAGSSAPLQHSKHVQVDLQDLGYETSGRSENEVEREETSSPEFDDLEMCTSLSLRDSAALSLWGSSSGAAAQHCGKSDVVMQLQTRPRDHEEDEGWQSSSDAHWASPAKSGTERELRELVCRVESLEEQLRAKGKGHSDGGKATNIPGVVVVRRGCVSLRRRFDSLIQAQARELCVLRGRVREGACVCRLLSRQLADTTKAFEELLRATDVDYYMGQSFREQLSQSGALAHRAYAKISGEDPTDLPDEGDKTELLAIRSVH
ncbi:myomegalin-like isoform X3 [Denticeps clupeoides]|uniref:myomegalin-like isoform X3 n=1 Tax=Denticeps clupeoides TaxID=299321 RepID=UPI0010A2C110|nr:myomegalin-like isoform X3 [Denticeps clupeoides]